MIVKVGDMRREYTYWMINILIIFHKMNPTGHLQG